jgi:hypothetical protein
MDLGTWNVQGLKNKCEIIIKDLEELKLYIIIFTETNKRAVERAVDWWIRSLL